MNLPDDDRADLSSVDVPAYRQPDDWHGGLRQPPTPAQTLPPISRPYREGHPMTYGPPEVHSVGKLDNDGTRLD